MPSLDVGSIVHVKPKALRDPALAGRQFHITQLAGVGRDAFTKLSDMSGTPLPAWYRLVDLEPAVHTRVSSAKWRQVQELDMRKRQQSSPEATIDMMTKGVRELSAVLPACEPNPDHALHVRAQHLATTEGLEYAAAVTRVLDADPALRQAWRGSIPGRRDLPDSTRQSTAADTQLAALIRTRAAEKGITLRAALREISTERQDLSEQFHQEIRGTERTDTTDQQIATAARDLAAAERIDFRSALRRVSTERVDLAGRFGRGA